MEEEHPTKRVYASRVDGQMGRRGVSVGYFIGVTCEVDAAAGSTSLKTRM